MAESTQNRIAQEGVWLVVEIRSWRFGFVVLGDNHLIDWGTREFPAGSVATARKKLLTLMDVFAPTFVLARGTRGVSHSSSKAAAQVLRSIRAALIGRQTEFVVLDRENVKQHFKQVGCHGKYEIARFLTRKFPELEWRVPKRRKAWDREDHIVPVFDALATAVRFAANRLAFETER